MTGRAEASRIAICETERTRKRYEMIRQIIDNMRIRQYFGQFLTVR